MSAPAVRQGDRSRRALAVGLAAVAVLELVLTVLLDRGAADLPGVLQDPYAPAGALVGAGFVAGGLLLCLAKPRNPVGWLLLAFTAFGTLTDLASVYALRAFALDLPLKTLAASVGGSIWLVSLYLLVPLLLLLYPDGRLPSPRWRWLCVLGAVGTALLVVAAATAPAYDDVSADGRPVVTLPLPVGIALAATGAALYLAAALAAVVGTLVRTARARGAARMQLLWLLVASTCVLVLAFTNPPGWLFNLALALVPFAVAVGVLRYRLLGIEIVVRGALLCGALTGLVLAVYVAVTVAISALVPGRAAASGGGRIGGGTARAGAQPAAAGRRPARAGTAGRPASRRAPSGGRGRAVADPPRPARRAGPVAVRSGARAGRGRRDGAQRPGRRRAERPSRCHRCRRTSRPRPTGSSTRR